MTDEHAIRDLNKMGFVVEYKNPYGKNFKERYRVWRDREHSGLVVVDKEGAPEYIMTFEQIQ